MTRPKCKPCKRKQIATIFCYQLKEGSIRTNFGKIFERLLFVDRCEHLKANRLLSENRAGIHQGDSTVNQLLAITQKFYSTFNQIPSREMRAVFPDSFKPFDKVWHAGLLYKIESNGISGNLLKLIRKLAQLESWHSVQHIFFL